MSAENIDPCLHEPDKLCKQDMLIEYIDPHTPEPTIPKDLPENLNDMLIGFKALSFITFSLFLEETEKSQIRPSLTPHFA